MKTTRRSKRGWQRFLEREFKKVLLSTRRILALKKPMNTKAAGIEITLVGDNEIKVLNKFYRHKDSVTDILSFPNPEIFQKQGLLGSLVICLPQAKRQAKSLNETLDQELSILLVHGFLHLLGFDHEKSTREANMMKKLESALLGNKAGLIQRSR